MISLRKVHFENNLTSFALWSSWDVICLGVFLLCFLSLINASMIDMSLSIDETGTQKCLLLISIPCLCIFSHKNIILELAIWYSKSEGGREKNSWEVPRNLWWASIKYTSCSPKEKAHSHQRQVLIFEDYRKYMQIACHLNTTTPKTKITTLPFLSRLNNSSINLSLPAGMHTWQNLKKILITSRTHKCYPQ